MYYSTIGILAILILFIVNWDILHVSRTYEKAAWNVYRRFLFAVLIYYLVDVLWGIIEAQKLAVSLFVDTTIYFVAMAVGISFWAEFTVAYLNEKGIVDEDTARLLYTKKDASIETRRRRLLRICDEAR